MISESVNIGADLNRHDAEHHLPAMVVLTKMVA